MKRTAEWRKDPATNRQFHKLYYLGESEKVWQRGVYSLTKGEVSIVGERRAPLQTLTPDPCILLYTGFLSDVSLDGIVHIKA
jgi:hypothetical protein